MHIPDTYNTVYTYCLAATIMYILTTSGGFPYGMSVYINYTLQVYTN